MDKIKSLIQHAKIVGSANNSDQFPVQQVFYKGKVSECLMIFSYGHYAIPDSDDSLVIVFEAGGDEDNKSGLAYTPQKRPTDLEQGEHAVYHPKTETSIKFRNNGNIEIDCGTGDLIINCNNATVNADNNATVSANGDVAITAGGNITLDGAQIQNNGSAAGVVTTLSINPTTGLPFPDGSDTVRAGDG